MAKTFLFLMMFPLLCLGGNDNNIIGGRAQGMGNTGLCTSDVWAIHFNQAALADLKKISTGISYESRFLSKNLGVQSFAFALPTKKGTFGIQYTGFGNSLYRETKLGIGYGMKLSSKFNAGIRINYHELRLGKEYGKAQNLTFEVGLLAKPTKNLEIAFHVFNPSQSKLNAYQNEIIPVVLNLGVSYKFSDKLRANVELEKDIEFPYSLQLGIEYLPVEFLYLRAGISTSPTLPSFGFGIIKNQFEFDFSASFHPALGITPAIGMKYTFK